MLSEIVRLFGLNTNNADCNATISNFAAFVMAVQNDLAHEPQMEDLTHVDSAN